jgi:hypothetical protein
LDEHLHGRFGKSEVADFRRLAPPSPWPRPSETTARAGVSAAHPAAPIVAEIKCARAGLIALRQPENQARARFSAREVARAMSSLCAGPRGEVLPGNRVKLPG